MYIPRFPEFVHYIYISCNFKEAISLIEFHRVSFKHCSNVTIYDKLIALSTDTKDMSYEKCCVKDPWKMREKSNFEIQFNFKFTYYVSLRNLY